MTSPKNAPAAKRAAPKSDAAQTGPSRQALQVISKRDGFRRAGREWHGSTMVPLDELTEKQIEQLESEPMLVVLQVEASSEAASDDSTTEQV